MNCYVINLDRSPDRWESVQSDPGLARLNLIRVPGIEGKSVKLPHKDISPWGYFLFHGRKLLPGKIGCYLSHSKAIECFLESGEEHAVICEDDVLAAPELADLIQEAMKYSHAWDFIRLIGNSQKAFLPFAELGQGYRLISDLCSGTSAGGYLLNRKAARILLKIRQPMCTNNDISLYFGIPNGIREATVSPFPLHYAEVAERSCIGYDSEDRYPIFHPATLRFLTVLPCRLFTRGWRHAHRLCVAVTRWLAPPKPRS